MRSGLLSKRSCPVLESRRLMAPNAAAPGGDQGEVEAGLLNVSRGSSRVWSEIRGAIRAIGKTSHSAGSEGSTGYDCHGREKGKAVARASKGHVANGDGAPSPVRRGKSILTRDLAKRLGLHSGYDSSTTVVLRGSPLKRQHAAASERVSSASSRESSNTSLGASESLRTGSTDTRVSDTASVKDYGCKRPNRRHPWSKSSPDGGTLQTIDEGCFLTQPTVLTVERAAAAKIHLETHFNELLNRPSARTLRRQYLESQLYYSPHLTVEQKTGIRRTFFYHETCCMRETRALKAQSQSWEQQNRVERYEILKILGRGSFGVVKLMRERPSGRHADSKQVYAMKVIRKSDMLRSGQEGHLRAERDFLVASEGSSWIIPLVASFQDPKSLYLVMEYMPGGDFLGLLIREQILHEAVARFYIAEMILAVEESHRLRFIHRDIKPDNFLISASGHLKISDFGLAFDGHWSHDASYYNCQRYSLLQRLGVRVDGDDEDKKKCENISTQLPWLQNMKDVLQRHEKQDRARQDDLPQLLG